ncbi:hypothetical protein [Candidatus Nitrospira bockiana]
MSAGAWAVKKLGGEEWGHIRKLIIDPLTRQLSFADILVAQTKQVVRLPWSYLEVKQDGIFLKPATQSGATAMPPTDQSLVALDVPTNVPGKLRPTKTASPFRPNPGSRSRP